VTRSLTLRARGVWGREAAPEAIYDVFLSFGSEDLALAQSVHGGLTREGLRVFFSDDSRRTDFHRAINDALSSATAFVAVGTEHAHLTKRWVLYECDAFHGFILSGSKPSDSPMVTLTPLHPSRLPLPLCARTALKLEDPAHPESAILELLRILAEWRDRKRRRGGLA